MSNNPNDPTQTVAWSTAAARIQTSAAPHRVELGGMRGECYGFAETAEGYIWSSRAARVFCYFLFFSFLFHYNVLFLGRLLPEQGRTAVIFPLGLVFNTLWALAIGAYLRVQYTDPGRLPKRWQDFVVEAGAALAVQEPICGWQPGFATLCLQCDWPRPERAHHCSVCGVCVMRYDHHCIWINNCVGINNHKYFLLVGFYSMLATVFAFLTTLSETCGFFYALGRWSFFKVNPGWSGDDILLRSFFTVGWFFYLQFATSMTIFCIVFFRLASKNLTKVEDVMQHRLCTRFNPYDQGSAVANVAQVFGQFGFDWLLPIVPRKPLSDGVIFPTLAYPLEASKATAPCLRREWGKDRPTPEPSPPPPVPAYETSSSQGLGGLSNLWGGSRGSRENRRLIRSVTAEPDPIRECQGPTFSGIPRSRSDAELAEAEELAAAVGVGVETWSSRYRTRVDPLAASSWFFWLLGSEADPSNPGAGLKYDGCCPYEVRRTYWV
mmetsp:Transcript_6460/g.14923  ORF Transcript_6460/g.14923 Transcript_6460/m.14923 type:complete len:493 (-) Transcript_6460:265-1743(-)